MLFRSFYFLSFASLVAAGIYWLAAGEPNAPQSDGKHAAAEGPENKESPMWSAANVAMETARKPDPLVAERNPATGAEGGLSEFEGRSRGRWFIKKDSNGFVTRLAEAQFYQEASTPGEAAREFVQRYGKALFGAGPGEMGDANVVKEEDGSQVRIPQKLNSLPVLGAELNLIYDNEGNLIYAASSLYSGSDVPSTVPAINALAAAAAVRSALSGYFSGKGSPLGDGELSLPALMNKGSLAYRLSGNRLALVYRYELVLEQPRFGDLELIVDAATGGVVALRELSRK